jgi:hypothetical protein
MKNDYAYRMGYKDGLAAMEKWLESHTLNDVGGEEEIRAVASRIVPVSEDDRHKKWNKDTVAEYTEGFVDAWIEKWRGLISKDVEVEFGETP